MTKITQIGKYAVVKQLSNRHGSLTFEVLDQEKQVHLFCKVISGLQPTEGSQRMFRDIARKLARLNSSQINAPIDSGYDQENGYFYICYPILAPEQSLKQQIPLNTIKTKAELQLIVKRWKLLTQALSEAQSLRIFHKDIHPENILFQENGEPVLVDFGLVDITKTLSKSSIELKHAISYTAPEVLAKAEDPIEIRSDIYSLALCMLECVIGNDGFAGNENNERRLDILRNTLVQVAPTYRVSDLFKIFENCLASNPQHRPAKYSDIIVGLSVFQEELLLDRKFPAAIYVSDSGSSALEAFFQELNASGAKIYLEKEKYISHSGKDQIKFRLATKSYFAPRCFLEGNTLKLLNLVSQSDLDVSNTKSFKYVQKRGVHLDFEFKEVLSINQNKEEWLDVEAYFDHLYYESGDQFSTVKLTENQKGILSFYERLLEGELEYLQRNAFSIKYKEFTDHGNEFHFKVEMPDGKTWKDIHNFVQKSSDPSKDDVDLVITDKESPNGRPLSVGRAVRYDQKDKLLVVRDFGGGAEGIPIRNGELREDVFIQEVQFKRQQKAIKAFRSGDFSNKDLCAYLFNPQTLPDDNPILPELENVLSHSEDGRILELYEAQDQAVRKILHTPPVTMVQGPPGTGKTTVIVEAIRQIIRRDPQSKILITSQSNFAVDNVLQKLTKAKMPIIRLGKADKIKQASVKAFALDKSLRTWADNTKSSHETFMKKFEGKSNSQSITPTLKTISNLLRKGGDWEKDLLPQIVKLSTFYSNKYPKLFDSLSLGSRASFEEAFSTLITEQTGDPQYQPLRNISDDWLRLLNNLNEKSDLVSKMVDSVNVIGATSNHIAASAYGKFEFDFDYVIMDEAAKATPAESLVPISMGKNIVLVGDHLQLRPIVTTNKKLLKDLMDDQKEELLENPDQTFLDKEHPSLFEMMFEGAPEDFKEALDTQRRMPGEVSDLISKYFYDIDPYLLKIKTTDEKRQEKTQIGPIRSPILLLDTGREHRHEGESGGFSILNPHNAKLIVDFLKHLDQLPGIEEKSIGIITGYGAQAKEIRNRCQEAKRRQAFKHLRFEDIGQASEDGVSIATVDSFQGLEKDIIIFDLVRSEKGKHLGFLEVPNRINVAFSRVKQLLVIVGDIESTIHALRMKPNIDKEKAPLQKILVEMVELKGTYKNLGEVFNG